MAKIGRPKKTINYDLAEELASIFCTQEEIANIMDVSLSTLTHDEKFLLIYKKGFDQAKSSLRRLQWKHAQTNSGMAIWLGKQYLQQREFREVEIGASADIDNRLAQIARALSKSDTDSEEAVS